MAGQNPVSGEQQAQDLGDQVSHPGSLSVNRETSLSAMFLPPLHFSSETFCELSVFLINYLKVFVC